LLDNGALEQALSTLAEDDFFSTANRQTYAAMLQIQGRGETIDPLTLQEELRRMGQLSRIGGPAYIASMFDGVSRFSNIESSVKLVGATPRERLMITFANEVMARAWDGEDAIDEQLRQAEQDLALIGYDSASPHWAGI